MPMNGMPNLNSMPNMNNFGGIPGGMPGMGN